MSTVEFVIKRLKEEDVEPAVDEGICRYVCILIELPECPQKVGVIVKPALALDKVEEHAAVEELQGEIVRPPTIFCLSRQVVQKDLEDGAVVFKESLCDGFDIEGFFMTGLDFEGRDGCENGTDARQVEHVNPFGRGAEFLVWANRDAAE